MLPQLKNGKNFTKSVAEFEHKSSFIENEEVKKELHKLIALLKEQVGDLEQAHRVRTAGDLKPSLFGPNRQNISKTRKAILTIFSENNTPKLKPRIFRIHTFFTFR